MKFFWGFITGSLSVATVIALAMVVMNRLEEKVKVSVHKIDVNDVEDFDSEDK